ncbi:MAG: hypothetical protein M3133_11370, partial [Actinomycetota bacterium]|nr:hypothetical protein [Actinomycetota bacterium]
MVVARILVATAEGLQTLGDGVDVELSGRDVRALARDEEGWWVVAEEGVLLRGRQQDWQEVARADVPMTCLLPASERLFAGTAGAGLRHLVDGRLEPVQAFDETPGRHTWYTPWGGPPATRSLSAHPDGTLFVNVHVGGIVRSRDGGRSWEPTIDVDLDVHEVRVEPRSGRVLAATGAGGFALSEDRGDSWQLSREGLHAGYCRAVAVAGTTILLSASTGPRTRRGAVYRRSLNGEGPFERCQRGLPAWFEGNVDTGWLDAVGGLAVLATPAG